MRRYPVEPVRRRLVTRGLAAALAAASLFAVGAAAAQERARFGSAHSLAITGEPLTGFYSVHRKYDDQQNLEYQTRRSDLSLLFRSGGVELGAHYFVIPALSVGASVGYEARSGANTIEDGTGTYTNKLLTESSFVARARVGYALMFTDVVGFWFRAGPGYLYDLRRSNEWERDSKSSDSVFLAGADVLFLVTPVPHFGFYLGPSAEIGVYGRHVEHQREAAGNVVTWRRNMAYDRLGGGLGLVGYFD